MSAPPFGLSTLSTQLSTESFKLASPCFVPRLETEIHDAMKRMLIAFAAIALVASRGAESAPETRHAVRVKGTHFTLDGTPFPFTGYSFFNAVFNPTFNQSSAVRREW